MSDVEHLLADYGRALDELCPEVTTSDIELRLVEEQETLMAPPTAIIPDRPRVDDSSTDSDSAARFWESPRRRRILAAVAAAILVVAVGVVLSRGDDGAAPVITDELPLVPTREQQVPFKDRSGDVEGSVVTLRANNDRAEIEIATTGLEPGHAVTVWITAIDMDACLAQFPTGGQELQQTTCASTVRTMPELGNVGFLAGGLVDGNGELTLEGEVHSDGLTNQWFDTPLASFERTLFQLDLRDHGVPVEGLLDEMISTYRGGCANTDDVPAVAEADGTPGPNLCREGVQRARLAPVIP